MQASPNVCVHQLILLGKASCIIEGRNKHWEQTKEEKKNILQTGRKSKTERAREGGKDEFEDVFIFLCTELTFSTRGQTLLFHVQWQQRQQ